MFVLVNLFIYFIILLFYYFIIIFMETTFQKICPLYGLNQHFQECWHDSLTTLCFFSDGIGDKIQNIFNNHNIKEINNRIRNNFKFKKIPEYYLPFNVENTKKDLTKYYKNSYEYVKNLYTIYTNIKSYNESLTQQMPFFRQSSEIESYSCIRNIYNMYNINKIKADPYTINNHSGILPHYVIQLNTINYLFMNFSRKSNTINRNIEYIYPEIIDFKFYIELLSNNFIDNYVYITNLVFHLGRILELLPQSLGVIITSYEKDEDENKNIYYTHDQAFITCNKHDYFYDNNGVDDNDNSLTTLKFEWRQYLEKKIKFIIHELNTKFIKKTDYTKEKLLAFIELIESISDFYKNHHIDSNFQQVGKQHLESSNVISLLFIYKNNEKTLSDYYKNYNRIFYYSNLDYYYNNNKTLELKNDFDNGVFGFDKYNFPSYIIDDLKINPKKRKSKLLKLKLPIDNGSDTINYVPLFYYKQISQKLQQMQQIYNTTDVYKQKTNEEIKEELKQRFKQKYQKYKNKYLELKKIT